MPNLTKTSVKVLNSTKNGEITINLNLNISVSKDGKIDVSVENNDAIDWEIPDIEVGKITGDNNE